jgi:hypothetical protein
MPSTYNYSLLIDFTTSHNIEINRFINDIKINNNIVTKLFNVNINGDNVTLIFESALSINEKLNLDTIVANHVPTVDKFDMEAILRDVRAPGTNGGSFASGSWMTRKLNTVIGVNVDLWITLSNDIFTLIEGKYIIFGKCPVSIPRGNSNGVGDHQIRLFNLTSNQVELYGINSDIAIRGTFNVPSGGSSYIVQHRCQYTQVNTGLGYANGFGGPEVYSEIIITKQ